MLLILNLEWLNVGSLNPQRQDGDLYMQED